MDQLKDALYAAVADPPPTAIDLDRLIERTQRRTRLRYRFGMAAGALAIIAAAVSVPLAAGHRTGNGIGAPPPTASCPQIAPTTTARPDRNTEPALPAEPCTDAERRLVRVLVASLGTELPGWTPKNADDTSAPVVFLRQAVDSAPDGYVADVQVFHGNEFHLLLVQVSAHPAIAPDQVCVQPDLAGATCTTMPEGDVVAVRTEPYLVGSSDGIIGGYKVTDVRPDGTTVTVLGSQALMVDRITRIARTPGLSLLP